MQKTTVVAIGALICCALWGSAFPFIKIGYRLMRVSSQDTATQILYAGCRFFLAGVLAIIIGSVLQRRVLIPRKEELPHIGCLALLQTILQYLFFYIGLAHTSGVKASIIDGMNVFFAVLVAGFFFHQEKVTVRKLFGCVVGFAGVVLVNLTGQGLDASFRWNGEGFILLSALAYAFSSACIKRFSAEHDPVMLSGYQFVLGGLVMIVCGWALGGRITQFSAGAAGVLLHLAYVSAVAYSLWGILLKYHPVSKVSVFGFMTQVFGVLLSAWLLGETQALGVNCLVALGLVCGGIIIVQTDFRSNRFGL
jgi:drug/metabolite transporter (DMT)-like permease